MGEARASAMPIGSRRFDALRHLPEVNAVVFGEAMLELSDLQTDSCRVSVAGDTFNTAVYMSRHGLKIAYATCLGLDPVSDMIMEAMDREGIETRMVLRTPGAPGLYAISVDDCGERSFTYWRSNSAARSLFELPDVDTVLRKATQADMLYLSGITLSLFQMPDLKRLRDLAVDMKTAGKIVAFDTNYRANGWASVDDARVAIGLLAPFVTIALPTFEDEHALHGDASAEQTALRWLGLGAEEVVVKQGADGAYVSGHGMVKPVARIQPKDTTGAGDSFNGAYLCARAIGHDPIEAASKGHRLAAQVIMTRGAILPKDEAEAEPIESGHQRGA